MSRLNRIRRSRTPEQMLLRTRALQALENVLERIRHEEVLLARNQLQTSEEEQGTLPASHLLSLRRRALDDVYQMIYYGGVTRTRQWVAAIQSFDREVRDMRVEELQAHKEAYDTLLAAVEAALKDTAAVSPDHPSS